MEKKLITTGFLVSTLLGCMMYSLYKAEKVLQKQDSKTSSELIKESVWYNHIQTNAYDCNNCDELD